MAFYGDKSSLGHVQLTVDTATALTVPENCVMALITPQAQAVRWRDDGIDPSATVGYPLAVGAELRYDAGDIKRLKFISQTAGGVINVAFYGRK